MDIKDIIGLFTLAAGLVTGLWVYTKYILERGFLPPVRFYLTVKRVGDREEKILDIRIHLHNLGSATLIARNIRLDLLYLKSTDTPFELFSDQHKGEKVYDKPGRLIFPNSVIKDKKIDPSTLLPRKIREAKDVTVLASLRKQKHRGFLVLEDDTFVQAGVDQVYTFVTMVPKEAVCCLIWSSFQYAQKPKMCQRMIYRFSRFLGLVQFTLEHVHTPHTVEEVFWIAD